MLAPFYRWAWSSYLLGACAGVWWSLGSELVGSASRLTFFPLFHTVDPISIFTCCDTPLSKTVRHPKLRGEVGIVREVLMLPWGSQSGSLRGTFIFWVHSQPQGQRPRTHKRCEINSDIKKEAGRTEWSLWACILNVFSLCKKKRKNLRKLCFYIKGSLCFIAILIYGPYIPVIVLNWIAK